MDSAGGPEPLPWALGFDMAWMGFDWCRSRVWKLAAIPAVGGGCLSREGKRRWRLGVTSSSNDSR